LRHTVERLGSGFARQLDRHGRQLDGISGGLRPTLLAHLIDRHRTALGHAASLLDSYSYEQVLKRGFVLVRDAAGAPLGAAAQVAAGQALHLQFQDGVVEAIAAGDAAPARRSGRKSGDDTPPTKAPPQGSLL